MSAARSFRWLSDDGREARDGLRVSREPARVAGHVVLRRSAERVGQRAPVVVACRQRHGDEHDVEDADRAVGAEDEERHADDVRAHHRVIVAQRGDGALPGGLRAARAHLIGGGCHSVGQLLSISAP